MARAVALAVVLSGLVPGIASAAALDHVSMFSDHDDPMGWGDQRFFTPATGSIIVRGTTGDLTVGVGGGTFGETFTLEFAAPRIRGGPAADVLVGRDRLDCGAGRRDVARGVSRSDSVSRCERVARTRARSSAAS